MNFAGLQKMTLMDYPQVVSCIIFTQGCNFRCPFCHNSSLVDGVYENEITETEILDFLEKRKGLLDGVVISGGEPLLHSEIYSFIKKVKELGFLVKLDTNGSNPDLLKKLVEEKLVDYVAMDIKNSPEEYSLASGTEKFLDKITESKDFLLQNFVDYEFRTTIVKGIHTKDSLLSAAKWISGAKRYFLQNYKDSGEILSPNGLSPFNDEELQIILQELLPVIQSTCIR